MSPNWYCTTPQVAPISLAMRLPDTAPGSPEASARSAASSMLTYTDPKWDVRGCYITQITGDPSIYSKHLIFPKEGTDLSDPESFASIGMTVTGLPALNAIKAVASAPPGILTSADMPLRGFAGRFKKS
jgi:hypothetical protein